MSGYDPRGKTALVTGAARGIGYETARQLHARGSSVVIVDLDERDAREAAERIGGQAIGIGADVTDFAAMTSAVTEGVERFGGLDIVIANAGIAPSSVATVRGMDFDEWERVFEVDLLGVWRTVRAALPQVGERQGQVVLVSSVFAFLNGIFNSPYAVAKAGGESLGRTLQAELAPLGASACVAYLGAVDTKLLEATMELPHSKRMQEGLPDFLLKSIGPDDAAAVIVRGIEARAPRVFAPRWLRYAFAFRGVLAPLLDRRLARDERAAEVVSDVEAEAEASRLESNAGI